MGSKNDQLDVILSAPMSFVGSGGGLLEGFGETKGRFFEFSSDGGCF